MSISRIPSAIAAFIVLIGLSSPSHANDFWETLGEDPFAAPGTVYRGNLDLSSSDWYLHWLFLRQNSSSAALYNQPCFLPGSDLRPVSCRLVAITEAEPCAHPFVAGGPAIVAGAVVRCHRSRRTYGAAIRAKY